MEITSAITPMTSPSTETNPTADTRRPVGRRRYRHAICRERFIAVGSVRGVGCGAWEAGDRSAGVSPAGPAPSRRRGLPARGEQASRLLPPGRPARRWVVTKSRIEPENASVTLIRVYALRTEVNL